MTAAIRTLCLALLALAAGLVGERLGEPAVRLERLVGGAKLLMALRSRVEHGWLRIVGRRLDDLLVLSSLEHPLELVGVLGEHLLGAVELLFRVACREAQPGDETAA